ncbi:MAG: FecR domain-containing protein [Pyrinomonadaceae bacterium]
MKRLIYDGFKACLVAIALASSGVAQDDRVVAAAGDKYVISANAGGVNYTEGKISVFKTNGRSGYLLKGDQIQVGDRISTSSEAKAEILLNPGSYIRLDGGSSFEFLSTSLDDLRLNLRIGSAILEIIAADEFRVTVATPKTPFVLTRSGVYRIDVSKDGSSILSVWKGKAYVGSDQVKAGRSATVAGVQADVEKFDRDDKDEFDVWSKSRAKELAKINDRLERKSLRNTLLSSFNRRGGWNMYNSFGLWVFDAGFGMWTFLPFGSGWGSPYGFWYGRDLWNCRLPMWIYYSGPSYAGSNTGGSGNGNPVNNPNPSTRNEERRMSAQIPPFRRMEQPGLNRDGAERIVRQKSEPPSFEPMFRDSTPSSSGSGTITTPVSRGQGSKPE